MKGLVNVTVLSETRLMVLPPKVKDGLRQIVLLM